MKNLLYHSLPGEKSTELLLLLNKQAEKIFITNNQISVDFPVANDLNTEDQESLIIAFPDNLNSSVNEVLDPCFEQIQKFVQVRMKKRFGQILCLINAGVNGLLYSNNYSTAYLAAQGGLIGLIKTVSKEYAKRGIIANVLYIDWDNMSLAEIALRSKHILTDNTNLKGQVFALDGGKFL